MTHTPKDDIRITIHDATRLEWVATIPLPDKPSAKSKSSSKSANSGPANNGKYAVEFRVEIPAHLFVAQDHWRNLQVLYRLQSPLENGATPEVPQSPDALRELALSVAHHVKTLRQSFVRECFMANSLLSLEPNERRLKRLVDGFESVVERIAAARLLLGGSDSTLFREQHLVDEFLSNQILDFLYHARRAIDEHLLRPGGPHTQALHEVAEGFEQAIAERLCAEVAYREKHGFLTPTSSDPVELERYLERTNQLKKHFQALLFLRAKQDQVDSRFRDWGGVLGAMAASFFGFGLNTGLFRGTMATAGFSISMVALLGAAVYALQDRIKEMGRNFLTAKMTKFYAQRITKISAPSGVCGKEERLVSAARESFTARLQSQPDPLNPDLPVKREVMVLRYIHTGIAKAQPELDHRGIRCFKEVFRYDLSWLFARLDDALKPVPVIHRQGALTLAHAPRCYRLPVSVTLTTAHGTFQQKSVAVLHKRGLERFENETSHASTSLTAEAETAVVV